MHSTHNKGKSLVAERLFRTFKNKVYKYMASISKNGYIDKLPDIVNEYNNTYYKRIKMKHTDVNLSAYIDLGVKNNDKILILKFVIM